MSYLLSGAAATVKVALALLLGGIVGLTVLGGGSVALLILILLGGTGGSRGVLTITRGGLTSHNLCRLGRNGPLVVAVKRSEEAGAQSGMRGYKETRWGYVSQPLHSSITWLSLPSRAPLVPELT
jgi:hypothetical protein